MTPTEILSIIAGLVALVAVYGFVFAFMGANTSNK